ncbi:MAG: hypothetical protein K8R13_07940 [Methanococcoides sp.]|nr:hypothetical protein [Methanococcoides sp.]
MNSKSQRVATFLLNNRKGDDIEFWDWLGKSKGQTTDKKSANKFLLGSILDYKILAETAWENARRLAEDILGDPDDLWECITSNSKSQWISKKDEYSLHWLSQAHERVWRIGNEIVTRYDGDARKIWADQTPVIVLERLNELSVGEQIARMINGALCDTGQILGSGDVKADIHVRRVLGRVLTGELLSPDKATEITRKMNPENPWRLDKSLYLIGKDYCSASNPLCDKCYLNNECTFCNTN